MAIASEVDMYSCGHAEFQCPHDRMCWHLPVLITGENVACIRKVSEAAKVPEDIIAVEVAETSNCRHCVQNLNRPATSGCHGHWWPWNPDESNFYRTCGRWIQALPETCASLQKVAPENKFTRSGSAPIVAQTLLMSCSTGMWKHPVASLKTSSPPRLRTTRVTGWTSFQPLKANSSTDEAMEDEPESDKGNLRVSHGPLRDANSSWCASQASTAMSASATQCTAVPGQQDCPMT
eukprot:CAMPEP_0194526124 /NCGR_PEP_ID=MMETSP0253-20130528/61861_1 /TAXON_ID=2966 /ORGANISM="Noctiluca scintillans" /LENGTH=234 /DNA_ID=CAMNT_0039370923 /DNA_START=281 /DNA_END=983 /DNA_ORIENTATION=+